MSVINKMLRDLDARRAGGALPDLSRQTRTGVMQDTVSVGGRRRSTALRWSALLLLLLAAAAAAWYWQDGLDTRGAVPATAPVTAPDPTPQAVAPPEPVLVASTTVQAVQATAAVQPPPANTAPAAPVARAVPAQTPAGQVTKPATAAAVPPPVGAQTTAQPSAIKPAPKAAPEAVVTAARPATASVPVAAAPASSAAPAAPLDRAVEPGQGVAPRPTASPVQAASAPAAIAPQGPAQAQRSLNALQESMAQAQGLWNGGSREAATSLMRDTVAMAERVQASDMELQQLVRELARMELAQGRGTAVLELLTRLEPRLAGQADLWAVRGNAAQRLGRHADAVHAYQQALKLRGNEQRWMLGAAVSLAALGQLDAAARQTEQASALGPVNPEVLNYLRQAGVPLR